MIHVGQVISTKDPLFQGSLVIKPSIPLGDPSDDVITASMCAPNTGGDQGITSIPGPGSFVLFLDVQSLWGEGSNATFQHKYVWLGALATQTLMTKNQSVVANDAMNSDDYCNEQKDPYARRPDDPGVIVATGTPEEGTIYNSDGYPQKSIWKFLSGHKIVLSRLVDAVLGRDENSVLVQSAGGKHLRLDDGPPELGMDRISLRDENQNRLEIRAGGSRPNSVLLETGQDQEFNSLRGCQHMTIMAGSNGDQVRENIGTGNIEDRAHQGNHDITAYVDINRTSLTGDITHICEKGDITFQTQMGDINLEAAANIDMDSGQDVTIDATVGITFTCGESTITMTPDSIDLTSPLITINADVVNSQVPMWTQTGLYQLIPGGAGPENFHTHFWPGMFPIPTSIPIT